MLCPWSPRHAGGPCDTLHSKGQLLARLSRCVPVPPAGLLPARAVHRRLCSAAGEGSGLVLEGALRELAAVSLPAMCVCPLAAPREGVKQRLGQDRDQEEAVLQPRTTAPTAAI